MALFNRKKKQNQSVLPELDKYYEGERKERAGLTWLLAIVSVVLVAAFIILLFLAGRWAYRELISEDINTEEISINETQEGDRELPSFDGNTDNEESGQREDNNESESTQQDNEGTVDAPARTDTPSDPNAGYQPIPSSGDDPLPDTGPTDTIAVFIIATLLASGFYRFILSRKL